MQKKYFGTRQHTRISGGKPTKSCCMWASDEHIGFAVFFLTAMTFSMHLSLNMTIPITCRLRTSQKRKWEALEIPHVWRKKHLRCTHVHHHHWKLSQYLVIEVYCCLQDYSRTQSKEEAGHWTHSEIPRCAHVVQQLSLLFCAWLLLVVQHFLAEFVIQFVSDLVKLQASNLCLHWLPSDPYWTENGPTLT